MDQVNRFSEMGVRQLAVLLISFVLSACSDERQVTAQVVSLPEGKTETAPANTAFQETVTDRQGLDWPQFLGPHGTGISQETGLLKVWPENGPPKVWDREIGTGYSAPSVRGNRLVVHHRLKNEEIVECINASTGETLWKYAYDSRFSDPYGYNNGPRCSPLLTESHCYTLGAEGRLVCVTLDKGEPVWERKLREDYNVPEGFFGVGCTPILEGSKLIVLVGGQPNAGVVAFDSASGKTLWEAVGKQTWDGVETGWPGSDAKYSWEGDEMVVSYSSPITATIHGQRHVLCLMRQGLVSVDPETGSENFHYWFRSRTHESVNAARPVVVDDTILLSAAYKVGSVLLKVQPDGKAVSEVWKDANNLLTHWSTPIHVNGCYYGFSGRHENEGELRCIDASTGKVLWRTPGWERHNDLKGDGMGGVIDTSTGKTIPFPYYGRASKILADGKFIILGERGMMALVEPSRDGWKEISRCDAPLMTYPSWAAPVLSRGFLYLRDEDSLVCLDLSTKGEEPVGKVIVK